MGLRRYITSVLLSCVWYLNRTKDNQLSRTLHDMADQYDTRPSGQWSGGWR